MASISINRQIGSVFMIIGTEIGAGVLALPIIISYAGIFFGSLILILAWALMLYTALLICEANAALDQGISFASMAEKFLGHPGKLIVSSVFFFTLLAIIMAYVSAAGSTFHNMLEISPQITSTLFVVILGCCVIIGTKTVDYANRVLLSIKLAAFLIAIFLLLSTLKLNNLLLPLNPKMLAISIPAIVTTFILHNIIPTIFGYLQNDQPTLRKIVIIGSLIPLGLYLIWVIVIIGNIPHHGINSFDILYAKRTQANVGDLLAILSKNTPNGLIIAALDFVATISLTTSFLGTSISLYHFTLDLFRYRKAVVIRSTLGAIFITFIIPLIVVISYPNIFITALNYVGVGATILFVLTPIIIIKKMAYHGHQFSWSILNNNILLALSFLIGIGVIIIQFL